MKTDWTKVNRILKQRTGQPTPTKAELQAKLDAFIEEQQKLIAALKANLKR